MEDRASRWSNHRNSRRARSASSHGSDALGTLGIEDDDDGNISGDQDSHADTTTPVIPPKHRLRGRLASK